MTLAKHTSPTKFPGDPAQTSRVKAVAPRRARLAGVIALLSLAVGVDPVWAATAKKPVAAPKGLYQPNGRPPKPAGPFLWETQSTDPAIPGVGSFEAATTAIVPNNKLFKLLIIGSDARPKEDFHRARGDSLHVFVWNPAFNKGILVGIPRDAYVDLGGGKLGKITGALSAGGPENMLKVVNNLTKLSIDNYVITGFAGFSKMIDDIGGVNVLVDPAMNDKFSGATFAKGWFAMNGPAALAFTRNRKTVAGGDFGRSANQGKFLLYSMAKLREDTSDVVGLLRWINSFRKNADTNLRLGDFLILAQIARHIDPANIQNVVLAGKAAKIGKGKTATDAVLLNPGYVGLFQDVSHDGVNDGR